MDHKEKDEPKKTICHRKDQQLYFYENQISHFSV